MDNLGDIFHRKLLRETRAREQAEHLLEQKSLELFLEAEERQRALDALRESEERYRVIVELSPDAILMAINERIIFANGAARRLFRESESVQLTGTLLLDLTPRSEQERIKDSLNLLTQGTAFTHTEESAQCLDGSIVDVSIRRTSLTYSGRPAIQVIARDISERKKLEKQLAYQATHDNLTGTLNRSELLEQMNNAIAYAERHGFAVWVAFLDLDRFKQINDRFGHYVGDQLLIGITERLNRVLRKNDVLGRYGGDEFVLVMRGGPNDHVNSQLIERLMSSVCQPLAIESYQLQVTCSLGIATYPVDGTTADALLANADAAMYRAKESGRNLYQFYNSEINAQLQRRHRIEAALTQVLDRNELYLAYQPQISLETGKIVGAEALLRWNHPELGLLTPDQFIAYAEESSLINQIGAWVVQEACRQAIAWEREGAGTFRIAVNLSARQLNGLELLNIVKSALQASSLPPERLELELTETLMMSDVNLTLTTLRELHQMGVRVAVDDFGTGYSSLVYLQRLPLSSLKIDREFVQALSNPDDLSSQQIIITLIQLAHNLNLNVVAEGVEHTQQLDFLRRQNCDEIQGYLHSSPQKAPVFAELARAHRPESWQ